MIGSNEIIELSLDFGFIVIEGVNLFCFILIWMYGYVFLFNRYIDWIV